MVNNLNFISFKYAETAMISTKALINAIGKRPNHVITDYTGVKKYVNELNAFGFDEKLHSNAIILYIYIHFLNPNQDSHVNLDIYEASDFLKLSKRTVLNNLKILRKRGYINFVEGVLEGTFDIFIEHYNSIGLAADHGGRGYITLPLSSFKKIKEVKTTNSIRFVIRGLLESVPGKQSSNLKSGCSIETIKQFFPKSTKRKELFRVLTDSCVNELFNIKIAKSLKYCTIRPKPITDTAKIRTDVLSDAKESIKKLFASLNEKYQDNQFWPTNKELNDISRICLKVPCEDVKVGILKLYKHYTRASVKKLPALVRILATE